MSLSSAANRVTYTGNNAVNTYDYTYEIFNEAHLLVVVKETATGVETTLTISTDYTVTGVNSASGGTIVLVNASQAWLTSGNLSSTYTITIRRKVPLTQTTDIRNQGDFFPEAHEDTFDYGRMIDQQQQDEIDRAVKNTEGVLSSDFDPTLPADITTANVALVTNPTGTGFIVGPTTSEISGAGASAVAAAASALLASQWASQTNGIVATTDFSAKAWAVGGTDVTETASRGAAKEWATKTDNPVDTSEYSAKEYAQGTQSGTGGSAKDWAQETSTDVDGSGEYSAKEHAQGTQTRGAAGGGSAKDWAQYIGGTVDDTEFSAKKYANDAATSASSAAATLASAFFNDVIFYTSASSPVTLTSSDSGKLHSFDSSGGAITVNFPEISGITTPFNMAFLLTVAGNDVTFNRGGASDTIQGATSKVLSVANTGFQAVADTDPTPDTWSVLEFGSVGDGTVTTAKIADLNVTSGKLAANSVITSKILDGNVTRPKLATGAVAPFNNSTKTANYTVTTDDDVLFGNSGSGSFTFTMPTEASASGRVFTFQKTSSDFSSIDIDDDAGGLITTINTVGETVKIFTDGTSWFVMDRYASVPPTDYTPTTNGMGAVSITHCTWARNGKYMEINVRATTGTINSGEVQWGIPGSLTIDSTITGPIVVGNVVQNSNSSAAPISALATQNDSFLNMGNAASTSSTKAEPAGGTTLFVNSTVISFFARVPISQWNA